MLFLKYLKLVSVLYLHSAGLSSAQFVENLQAEGLLGSHFGIPGTPGKYDYVIVGGGTAGLTLARRLAANASNTVAVIEAGSFAELDNGNHSQVPSYAGYGVGSSPSSINPLVDWMIYTTPQRASSCSTYRFGTNLLT